MSGSKDRVVAGVAIVALIAGLSSTAILADPLKQLRSRLLDGNALVADNVNGRLISVNGSTARADLSITMPGAEGEELSIVQRDGVAYAVLGRGTDEEKVLYAVDDPSAKLPSVEIEPDESVLTGGGSLYTQRLENDELVVQKRDPETGEVDGDPYRFDSDTATVVDHSGALAAYEPRSGMLTSVGDGGGSAPVKVGEPGERVELGVAGDYVVVVRPGRGTATVVSDGQIMREIQLGAKGARARVAEATDGNDTAVLIDTNVGLKLVRLNITGRASDAIDIDAEFDSVEAPLVAQDGVYVARPSSGEIFRTDDEGVVETFDVPVGRGQGSFAAFVDDGFVYVNNPQGPKAAVVSASGVRIVDKYAEGVPEVNPNGNSPEEPDPVEPEPDGPDPVLPDPPQTTTSTPTPPPETDITIVPRTGPTTTDDSRNGQGGLSGSTDGSSNQGTSLTIPASTTTTTAPHATTTTSTTLPPPVASSPGSPVLVATAGDGVITVDWSLGDDGGSPVLDFVLSCTPDCGSGPEVTFDGASRSGSLTGLSNGTIYRLQVTARNAAGSGPASNLVEITPSADTPPSVEHVTVTMAADGSGLATVVWTPPNSAAGYTIDGYHLACATQSQSDTVAADFSTDVTQIGVGPTGDVSHIWASYDAGEEWSCAVTVRGTGPTGTPSESAPTTAAFIPWQAPAQVSGLVGTGGDGSATFSWDPVPAIGVAIRYDVYVNGSFTASTGETSHTLVGSNGDTLSVTVLAIAEAPTGEVSSLPGAAATATLHAPPTGEVSVSSPGYNQLVVQTSADWKGAVSRVCTFAINGGPPQPCQGSSTFNNVSAGTYSVVMTLSNEIDAPTTWGSNTVTVSDPPPPPPRIARTRNNPTSSRTFSKALVGDWGVEGARIPQNTDISDSSGRMCIHTGPTVGGSNLWVYLPWNGGWWYSPLQDFTTSNVPNC